MTSRSRPAETPVATGVATGSLGTGTAVDDDTTLMAVPEAPEWTEHTEAARREQAAAPAHGVGSAQTVAPVQAAEAPEDAPTAPQPQGTARRDPYRPIGIALAAILVALAGVAVLSSGGDTPAQVAPPAATAAPGDAAAGDEDDDDDDDEGGNNENNGRGNGRGNGNGNGNGGDNGRGNDD